MTPTGWLGRLEPCHPISCGIPPSPPNSHYECSSTNAGGECTLRCVHEAFQPWSSNVDGKTEIECTTNGTWVGPAVLACVPVECPKLQPASRMDVRDSHFSHYLWVSDFRVGFRLTVLAIMLETSVVFIARASQPLTSLLLLAFLLESGHRTCQFANPNNASHWLLRMPWLCAREM